VDLQEYIKKVYTIAYRLTGDETSAEDVASLAINRNANVIKDMIDTSILHKTTREVFSIFLMEPDKYSIISHDTKNKTHMQNRLMLLIPTLWQTLPRRLLNFGAQSTYGLTMQVCPLTSPCWIRVLRNGTR